MKALLIGCGKMGSLIARSLQKNLSVETLAIVDPHIMEYNRNESTEYYPQLSADLIQSSDCFFIATPANTHCELIHTLLLAGKSNIYVEKPAVINHQEYETLLPLSLDRRIVTGYILRQSPPAHTLKNCLQDLQRSGYQLHSCCVTYQKYLPYEAESRTQEDIGVFEEIVHIWDLLFNYLELGALPRTLTKNRLEMDPQRKDRTLSADLFYELKQENSSTRVDIHSSFKEPQRKREFRFVLKNADGLERFLTLSFDNGDEKDRLLIIDSQDQLLHQETYPALQKLDHQIDEVLHYFQSGEIQNLAAFHESDLINTLLGEISPEIQL